MKPQTQSDITLNIISKLNLHNENLEKGEFLERFDPETEA